MNHEQAKEILKRYRPGTDDAQAPEVADALALASADANLREWLVAYQESQRAVQSAFQSIRPPAGLKEQILSEGTRHPVAPVVRRRSVIAGAVALVLLAATVFFFTQPEHSGFERYRTRMVKTALRLYAMDLESADMAKVRGYLQQRGAPSDYELPPNLTKAALVGCGTARFDGQPVSLICFASGDRLPSGSKSDLWLFVSDSKRLSDAPTSTTPVLRQTATAVTAAWASDGKTYLLVSSGSETSLKRFL